MININPFKANPVCPKCGGKEINTIYHEHSSEESWKDEKCHGRHNDYEDIGEHLHRTCKCCKFEWLEKVKGAKCQNG